MFSVTQILPDRGSPVLDTGRGGYTVTMRESWGAEPVLQNLESCDSLTSDDGRLHLGWGSFRNLDIIAARKSSFAILCDINVHQFRVWTAVRQAAIQTDDIDQFIVALVPRLPSDPPLRQFNDSTLAWLQSDRKRKGSWLNPDKPERFHHIKKLFTQNRVVEYPLDMRSCLSDENTFLHFTRNLEQCIRESAVLPDTIYVSNVPWMLAQSMGFFGEQHRDHLEGTRSALEQCHINLSAICPLFGRVVSAMRLSPVSSPSDLQWKTEVLRPRDFLDNDDWKALTEAGEGVVEP